MNFGSKDYLGVLLGFEQGLCSVGWVGGATLRDLVNLRVLMANC